MVGTSGAAAVRLDEVTPRALQLARAHVRHERERGQEKQMRFLREQRLDRGAAAFVGHVHHLRAGEAAQELARKMVRAAMPTEA